MQWRVYGEVYKNGKLFCDFRDKIDGATKDAAEKAAYKKAKRTFSKSKVIIMKVTPR